MEITDRRGKRITVTDLKGAIAQVKAFIEYRHENPGFSLLERCTRKTVQLVKITAGGGNTPETYQTYRLKSNTEAPDLLVTLDHLVPISHTRKYSYRDLMVLTDDTRYQPDWNTPMGKEHGILHTRYKANFFKVRNTSLVVIPGTYLYPTALTENRIREMDRG